MRNGMPTSMMQLYGQDKLDPYGLNQGQEGGDASGGMMQSQNSQAMRNNLMGPFTGGGGGGMSLANMASMFSHGGSANATSGAVDHSAIQDALHIARQHFRHGGPNQVGGYNFKPEFLDEKDALTYGMMAEALKDGDKGMIAVGHNLNNRAWNGYLGDHDVRNVLLHQNARGTGGQYASFLENRPSTNIAGRNVMSMYPRDSEQYQHVHQLAEGIKSGQIPDPTNNASHFYNPSTSHPKWGNQLTNTTQIGGHKFGTEHGSNFYDPHGGQRLGDQQMMQGMDSVQQQAPGMPGTGPLSYNLPGNMRLPQLQPTSMAQPAPSIQQPAPAPAPMDNAPLPPMRPQSGPLQSEAGWKPPAEIADKPHSLLGDTPGVKPSIGGDVQFAPSNMSPASDISMSSGPFSDFGGGIGGSMGDFGGDFGGGLGDIFSSLFSRGGRTKFSDGGSDDSDRAHEFVRSQLDSGEPQQRQYVEENDFPSRIANAVQTADRYAGNANDAMAGALGLGDSFKHPENRSAREIFEQAMPQNPYDVAGGAVGQWNSGDRLGAAETMMSMPQTGMFIGKNAHGIDRAMYDTAQRDLMGYEGGPKPYGDLFSGGAHVPPKTSDQVFQQYGLHPYGQEILGDRYFDESKNVYAPKMWGEISDANAKADYNKLIEYSMAKRRDDAKQHFMNNKGYTEDAFNQQIWPELQRQFKAQDGHIQHLARLSDFYDHPELYEKYPHLKELPVLIDQSQGSRLLDRGVQGSYGTKINGTPGIVVRRKLARDDPEGFNSTLAHEIQHAIQDHEGVKSLGSKQMAEQIHTTPAWETWNNAMQNDAALKEFNALRGNPKLAEGEAALTDILSKGYEGDPKDAVEAALKRLDNQYPEYVRSVRLSRDLFQRGIPEEEPIKTITGHEAYLAQGVEGQSRNTQYRLDWDDAKRRSTSPLETIPAKGVKGSEEVLNFINPADILHKRAGGRVGYATGSAVDGEVSYMDETDKRPPMMAESPDAVQRALSIADSHQSPHDFVQSRLFDPNDQKQLPQYDPEAGERTAKEAALTAYGLTDAGGVQQALGYMPKAEGGFEPSVLDDFKSGNYLAAGLGLAGTIVPGGGKLAKAAREADAVSDATKVAQEVAAPTQKVADAAAPAAGGSSLWTPSAPKIIRPNESVGNTVGDVLAMNGYTDIPDEKYVYWRDALNEPATQHSQVQLYQIFNDALKSHLSLPDGMRRIANTEAMDALKPYLGETVKGVPHDLMTQNGKQAKAARDLGITNRFGVPVDTWGLSLSPGMAWNDIVRICGNDEICRALCLGKKSGGYALEGAMNNEFQINLPRANSIGRTIAMFQRPREFAIRTAEEIRALDAEAMKNGMALGLRMNTLSDLHPLTWEPFRNAFSASDFYDYTKHLVDPRGLNHHLTYSGTGYSSPGIINPHSNWDNMVKRLERGDNVAIVLNQKYDKPSQLRYNDSIYRVVDGDAHDFRPFDKQPKGEKGVVIALGKKEQGKGTDAASVRKKSGGFYFDYNAKKDGDTITVPDQRPFAEEVKKARLARKGRESGGYIPFERSNHADLYPNSHHFRDASPGTNKVPHIWDTKESKR